MQHAVILLLAQLPAFIAALYAAQAATYAVAWIAFKRGWHIAWPYLISALIHLALWACHIGTPHG